MKIFIGDQEIDDPKWNDLNMFLNAVFGRKRLLILKVDSRKGEALKELKRYCAERNLEYYSLHGENLKVDAVRGEIEISYIDKMPYSDMCERVYGEV